MPAGKVAAVVLVEGKLCLVGNRLLLFLEAYPRVGLGVNILFLVARCHVFAPAAGKASLSRRGPGLTISHAAKPGWRCRGKWDRSG